MQNIGVLMYTYNRTDDARINMEIIREVWSKNPLFKNVTLIHTFNGQKEWWPTKYLEDELLYLDNPGHFAGAELLINKGIELFQTKYPDTDYVITLASDTWCVKPDYLEHVISEMTRLKKPLATCGWGTIKEPNMFEVGMALDFNIINLKWATTFGVFPIGYKEFVKKYSDLFLFQDKIIYLERVFALRFKQAVLKSVSLPSENLINKLAYEHVYHLREREPIHIPVKKFFKKIKTERTMYNKEMGLITHHDPLPKQRVLKTWNLTLGTYGNQFLTSKDLTAFNKGLTKTYYSKDGKKIEYND